MLAAYRHHLHELAHMIVRAKAANPTLLVVWRQTTHQLLLDDAGAPELSLAASLREVRGRTLALAPALALALALALP